MTKEELSEIIKEELDKFLSEVSATGAVAGYEIPFAFTGNTKKNKKKRKESAEKSGYMIVKKFSDLNESVNGESNMRSRAEYYSRALAELYQVLKNEMSQFERDSHGTVNEDYELAKEALQETSDYIRKAIKSIRTIKK